ncbi:hypothetical protein FSP39_003522 [Pinctada imbricata]|uniref:Uncharacterized protein n=1 Tax=Pinctada imbricata TaxID=66713 RepID=A0AA89BYJ8_PINIB|nr:hypothetical protein FSP39_003522 [Pinctada imbricata]
MAGNTIKTYTKDEKDQTKLFTFPDRITQNVNLDICVVDVLDIDFSCRVVVVTPDSTIRFTYQGRPEHDKTFFVGDTVCDSEGIIILTDLYNHSIHVLSSEGYFMKFLITADDGVAGPYSLALYNKTLWVGCKAGVIKLYKLKCD